LKIIHLRRCSVTHTQSHAVACSFAFVLSRLETERFWIEWGRWLFVFITWYSSISSFDFCDS